MSGKMGRKKTKGEIRCGIYMIMNLVNKKRYIGRSNDIDGRQNDHKRDLRNNKHGMKLKNGVWKGRLDHLQYSYNKYGIENFIYEDIELCEEDKLNEREIYYIAYYKSNDFRYGYNKTNGGDGVTMTDEIKKKISERNKGRKHSEKSKKQMSIAKIGKSPPNKGIPCRKDTKQKISKKTKGRIAWNKGIPFNEETRLRISEGHMGQIAWNKGIPFNKDVRKKMSISRMGKEPANKGKNKYEENLEIIIQLFQEGNSIRKISKILNIPDRTIARYLRKQGFKLQCDQDRYKTEVINEILKLREKGYSYERIAKELNIGSSSVYRRLIKYYKQQQENIK